MIKEVQIREIKIEDSESITDLTNQLGSKVSSDVVSNQITEILKNPDHFAFVAIRNNIVVGYIHCFKAIRLTSNPFVEICGLVVDEVERGNGIGKLLVQKVENLELDCQKIRVRCNTKRDLAHKFYYQLNYTQKKEQKIFEKNITNNGNR